MINYPTSLDNFSNPTTSDPLKGGTVPHATQHSDANDAIEALQAKVGVNNSAVTSSHDYKLSEVTGSDKAVGKTATQTLSNKILTAPQINMGSDATGDMYFRNSSGVTSRLPIGATGTILEAQSSGIPAWVPNPSTADASTTVKGVSQEATQAQVLARTATGSTSARLFVNPSTLTTVQTYDYVADAGGTDAYAITVTPAPTAYVTGQVFRFKANTANTGTATLNVNSLGAVTIRKPSSSGYVDLQTGDVIANQILEVIYNGTYMIVTSAIPSGNKLSGYANTTTTSASNTSENTVATLSGHVMGANDTLVVTGVIEIGASGSVTNTYRIKIGSTTVVSWTSTISEKFIYEARISNRNSTSSQFWTIFAISTGGTTVRNTGTSSVATSSSFDVVITGQSTASAPTTSDVVQTQILTA